MKKVAVVGVSGNGKTTLARRLAAKLCVPYTELDALNHLPGWIEASEQQLRSSVEVSMSGSDGWVIDGSYLSKLGDLVLRQADTLVWLDQPLPLVLRRLIIRALKDILTKRDSLMAIDRHGVSRLLAETPLLVTPYACTFAVVGSGRYCSEAIRTSTWSIFGPPAGSSVGFKIRRESLDRQVCDSQIP